MIDRCTKPHAHNYKWYGAIGIKVCQEWMDDFFAFAKYVGDRPLNATLDRYPNQDGNYEPGNVRWATKMEQVHNQRSNINVTHDGRTLCLKEWAKEYDINYLTLYNRVVLNGMPIAEALEPISRHTGRRVAGFRQTKDTLKT